MRIVCVPHEMRRTAWLPSVPLTRLHVLHGSVEPGETVADLGRNDHLLSYPSSQILYRPHWKIRCRISILLSEPRGGHTQFYRTLPFIWWRFFRILTHDPRLLRKLPNGRHLPYGTTWVDPHGSYGNHKTRRMSLIASNERKLEGHKLRHRLADWIRQSGQDVDLLGRAYKLLDDKSEGLAPYRFSLVIENSREPGYFTEKLLDSFFCDTVPIYWGAPDIATYFDTRGMIVCETEDELRLTVSHLTEADYDRYMIFMPANRQAALKHVEYEPNAAQIILRDAEG